MFVTMKLDIIDEMFGCFPGVLAARKKHFTDMMGHSGT